MRALIGIVVYVFLFQPAVYARGGHLDSVSPIDVITSEELQKIPAANRNVNDILNAVPKPVDQTFQQYDLRGAKTRLENTLTLLNGRRTDQDLSAIPAEMIERIEVLKDGASSIYGSNAISGVVNIITKKNFELHPQELPSASSFTPIEKDWQIKGIQIGRLGINENGGQYSFGLSTYQNNEWSWNSGWKLGETYGLSGPIVALGKTPKGMGYSIYNANGAFIGDVNKARIGLNPDITGQYLLRAEYPALNPGYRISDRIFTPNEFNPYSVVILPQRQSMGDLFRIGGDFNLGLDAFKDMDDFMDYLDEGGCTPPYGKELIMSRSVLDIVPNDPLYQKSKKKKKGGVLKGLVGVAAGVAGMGGSAPVDKDGPEVFDQYSLPQIGFLPKSDPKSAWNLVDAEAKNVTVAVIDSGLDLTHPDAPQYIWTNEKEVPGNGIDDDKNGYVDDVQGWNFLDENNDVKDLRGHGTVVAGIIAARTNNGKGIAGINPGAVIMPLKVADKHGNANNLNIFRAIRYAVANGARVINVSLGAGGVSTLERLAINYARARGVLVVVASGNDGTDMASFGPSSVGSALAVGAVNFDGTRSTVSNWGANNGLVAPGEEIYSLHSKDAPWDGPSGDRERLYTKLSGTSFSAPMVAATASLLLVKDPKLTADDLEDILVSSARRSDEDDWNARTGAGFLDAAAALNSVNGKHFNVKVTGLRKIFGDKGKKLEAVEVFATVRGEVDHFTVEVGKGKLARSFKPVIGFAGQQAGDDLVARITPAQLRGSDDWVVLVRALDAQGKEHLAKTPLTLK